MKRFLIVKCSKCGEIRVMTAAKTFRCYRCGQLNKTSNENIISQAQSAKEARELLIRLKQQGLDTNS